MSISKDNEKKDEEHDCCDMETCAHQQQEPPMLRDVMKTLEENKTIPEGWVMVFMFADPEEANDGTQTDFFFTLTDFDFLLKFLAIFLTCAITENKLLRSF